MKPLPPYGLYDSTDHCWLGAHYELQCCQDYWIILDSLKPLGKQEVSQHGSLFDAEQALNKLKGTPKFK